VSTTAALPWFEPPVDLEMATSFWDAVGRGELVLPRCSECGAWQWYPEADGTDCVGGRLVWETVSPTGTLYSFTRVHRSFLPGGRGADPYLVGLVDLDGVDGPRLVVPLTEEIAIGERVEARFVTQDGHDLLAFGPTKP
jgi:uncharacterized OB-fold protein